MDADRPRRIPSAGADQDAAFARDLGRPHHAACAPIAEPAGHQDAVGAVEQLRDGDREHSSRQMDCEPHGPRNVDAHSSERKAREHAEAVRRAVRAWGLEILCRVPEH